MTSKNKPLVSVGLPVFNGEKGLVRALDALLEQDYLNLEIIISDNGSTDSTPEICEKYVRKDSRVKYSRSEENHGVLWNLNRVITLSKGKFFMRMSHDDIRKPNYISKCVALLEENEQAVLCHSYTAAFYGDVTNILVIMTLDSMEGIRCPRKRFMTALKHVPAIAIDGVIRTEKLKTQVRPLGNYMFSDIVLTLELSLYGEFIQVPEILFWRSGKPVLPAPQKTNSLYGVPQTYYPFLTVSANHIKSIFRAPLSIASKFLLLLFLILNETKIVVAKTLFRAGISLMGTSFPVFLLRKIVSAVENNPDFRMLKHPSELPPSLQPTWKLFNHRNNEQVLRLQPLMVEKLYKREPVGGKME